MKRKITIGLLWFVLSISLAGLLGAQTVPSSHLDHYRQELDAYKQVADSWERQAAVQIGLTLSIIVFGACITVLQGSTKGWCKTATILLGAGTSIFAGINAKLFSADYRVLQQSAIDAQALVEQLQTVLDRLTSSSSAADVIELEGQWVKTTGQFRDLEKHVLTGHTIAMLALHTVYAQTSSVSPDWARHPPQEDAGSFYFVGHANNASLATAETQSRDNAINEATLRIRSQRGQGVDEGTLRKFIGAFSSTEKSWFGYNKSTSEYEYYTLLRLGKDILGVTFVSQPEAQTRDITVKEHQLLRLFSDAPIYIYLRDTHTDGSADIYLLNSGSNDWTTISTLSLTKFEQKAKGLGKQDDGKLGSGSYVSRRLKKGDSIILSLSPDSKLTLKLQDSGYVRTWIKIVATK